MKKIIITILLVVPILVCVTTIIPFIFIYALTIKMLKYVLSYESDDIDDEEFMDKRIYDKYQYLTYENRLNFLYAVEKMLDEQYLSNEQQPNKQQSKFLHALEKMLDV